jgi:hypothetical protein
MPELNMRYFEELRDRINARLEVLQTPHRSVQTDDYPWLYGALGAVPSSVMFICENPSITGVRSGAVDTIDGRAPDIESQWWGGRKNPAAKRFRVMLSQLGLKSNRPEMRGGWNCYITNVVKEANVAGAEQRAKTTEERRTQASDWASVLRWELENVRPQHVFCVGGASFDVVTRLQR